MGMGSGEQTHLEGDPACRTVGRKSRELFEAQPEHLARMIQGHCAYYGLSGNGWPQPSPAHELGPDECTLSAISLKLSIKIAR